ncbi:MAG: hypothetical protein UW28_C0014G0015 [Parcubacteria group bacterium GW2011_GWA2_44_13]|nr:MAG: hypothetical protein UW28_C0014G0015 [Parcubacteria group bacterium GW2011_GWA2_44_13]
MNGFVSGTWPSSGFCVFSKMKLPSVGVSFWVCLLFDQYQKPAATIITATIIEARIIDFDLKSIQHFYNTIYNQGDPPRSRAARNWQVNIISEAGGFEPPDPVRSLRFSGPVPSTAQPRFPAKPILAVFSFF